MNNNVKVTLTQSIPNYFSGFESKIAVFSNLEEFKNIEWLKHWYNKENFYRFSVSEPQYYGESFMLMAELNEGYKWWVVGYLDKPVEWLPEWVAKE